MRTAILLAALVALSGCGAVGSSDYTAPSGAKFKVDHSSSINSADLPTNTDLKMVDGDLARYAAEKCGLSGPVATLPDRCDLYAQPGKDGNLVGYIALTQDKDGAQLSSETILRKTKRGDDICHIEGRIFQSGENYKHRVSNVRSDFSGQIMYASTTGPRGGDAISDVGGEDADVPDDAALGVWYVKTSGDKLRINQEQWNYCDDDIYIDDVFYRVVRLSKSS